MTVINITVRATSNYHLGQKLEAAKLTGGIVNFTVCADFKLVKQDTKTSMLAVDSLVNHVIENDFELYL